MKSFLELDELEAGYVAGLLARRLDDDPLDGLARSILDRVKERLSEKVYTSAALRLLRTVADSQGYNALGKPDGTYPRLTTHPWPEVFALLDAAEPPR